jgi:hypothetical protein
MKFVSPNSASEEFNRAAAKAYIAEREKEFASRDAEEAVAKKPTSAETETVPDESNIDVRHGFVNVAQSDLRPLPAWIIWLGLLLGVTVLVLVFDLFFD